ncbi:thiamine pyrophosphate-binding protein [bacterium]|nr:thiamine pyrophosphate-binding protein [bacterium]
MKVSNYIVKLFEDYGVQDVFGYPGVGCGHLMNSLKGTSITNHLVYNEQGAAFAVCSYAQASHRVGIAYSTAGPGGTNLVTGIANAYCDSIPTIFIVGEKDLASLKGNRKLRQCISQEVDIVRVCKPISKWSAQITKKEDIAYIFEKAFYLAQNGRPGPIVIDFPSDIQRSEIDEKNLRHFKMPKKPSCIKDAELVIDLLNSSKKPLFLIGNGAKQAGLDEAIISFAKTHSIPFTTTLICCDLVPNEDINLGYIGMDGDKSANLAVSNCDLLVSFGARLNFKQVCNNRQKFAPNAKVIRIDCDINELEYELRDEIKINKDLRTFVPEIIKCSLKNNYLDWCNECVLTKKSSSKNEPLNIVAGNVVSRISESISNDYNIVTDTGSHRRWVMSSFKFKNGQKFFQSAGLASMGYAIPASIGAYYATRNKVICFEGDGGLMMNLQELEMINRDRIPISIIVFNNQCLGDIMEFQKKIFHSYFATTEKSGYKVANFELIAKAFSLNYVKITNNEDLSKINVLSDEPQLIEVMVPSNIGEEE